MFSVILVCAIATVDFDSDRKIDPRSGSYVESSAFYYPVEYRPNLLPEKIRPNIRNQKDNQDQKKQEKEETKPNTSPLTDSLNGIMEFFKNLFKWR